YPVGKVPFSILVNDFNGDNIPDLAVGSSSSGINRIGIMTGNGDGSFQTHVDHATKLNSGGPSEAIGAGDFDRDGAMDIASADQVANSVSVFINSPMPALFPGGPSAFDFGTLAIGDTSTTTVTLYNSGAAQLSNVIASTTTPSDYSETSSCSSLPIGSNCTTQ